MQAPPLNGAWQQQQQQQEQPVRGRTSNAAINYTADALHRASLSAPEGFEGAIFEAAVRRKQQKDQPVGTVSEGCRRYRRVNFADQASNVTQHPEHTAMQGCSAHPNAHCRQSLGPAGTMTLTQHMAAHGIPHQNETPRVAPQQERRSMELREWHSRESQASSSGGRASTPSTEACRCAGAAADETLLRELTKLRPALSSLEASQIQDVLSSIRLMCWTCASQGFDGPDLGDTGELLTIGSAQLGTMRPSDEVDVLYSAPLHVQLEQLHGAVGDQLTARGITVANVSRDGHFAAPGLRFVLNQVRVKLLFGQRTPGLQQTPEALMPSLAGHIAWEVSETLLNIVPNPSAFRCLVRLVRAWAEKRGIYGTDMGYFSGMAWSICCAKACQAHPTPFLSSLAASFFLMMAEWDWKHTPLQLYPGNDGPENAWHIAGDRLSDTRDLETAPFLMNVMIPVVSGISATPCVSSSTSRTMLSEFRRAEQLVHEEDWSSLLSTFRFFQKYQHYLQLEVMGTSLSTLTPCMDLIAQQLPGFLASFDDMADTILVRPWPSWVSVSDSHWPCTRSLFLGLHVLKPAGAGSGARKVDVRLAVVKLLNVITKWPQVSVCGNQFDLGIRHVPQREMERLLRLHTQADGQSQDEAWDCH